MMREWEVVAVRDYDRAATEGPASSVALIDLGDTDAGLEMADRLYHGGVTIPCVVVGDKPVDGRRAIVLVRPFTLEDLTTAVGDAASGTVHHPPAERQPAEPVPGSLGNGAPEPGPLDVQEHTPEPEPPYEPARRLGLVRPAHAGPDPEHMAPEPAEEIVESAEAGWDPEPEPEPQPAWEPEPVVAAASQPADAGVREVWYEPLPDEAPAPAQQAGRWKRRRRSTERVVTPEPETEAPLVRRLRVAAEHARELTELVEQLPFLADLSAMADGLIDELDRQFVCAVASVSVLRGEGFEVVAHRGLSKVEAGMVIPPTQSLVSDVLKTGEGILIQPVDLAQGLVGGIGGARTEALMIAPALVGRECYAMVVVGGDQFAEIDLDRLSELAAEAAPGLAVALLLDRLRSTAGF